MLDIMIIGHGAIASYVAERIPALGGARLVCVLCRPGRQAAAAKAMSRPGTGIEADRGPGLAVITDLSELVGTIDLAIDCAGHQALGEHGCAILERGVDLMTVSVGALADDGLAARLEAAARKGGARLRILSGAIGGIDVLTAARTAGLDRVLYRGRKPPKAWLGSLAEQALDLGALRQAACHFRGSARDAAALYPKNANVAATVALAGLGLDATRVELIADPAASQNIHEVEADGAFGQLRLTLSGNSLPDNPKSSALTAMSVVQAIQRQLAPVVMG